MSKEAPPAPQVSLWTGFYAGVFGGYSRTQTDPDLSLGGGFNQLPPGLVGDLERHGSGDFDFNSGLLGGLIGYNYQIGHLVVGVESTGAYLWARDSESTGIFVIGGPNGSPPLEIRSSFRTNYLFTVGPRIGFAFRRVMPYVTGGLAVGDLDFSQDLRVVGDPTGTHAGGRTSETNAGWMVGGGVEFAVTDHWHARAQYQYVDLGSVDFGSEVSTQPGFIANHSAGLTEHNATFALIYKF